MSFLEFEQVVRKTRNRPDVKPEGPQPHVRAQELVDGVFGIAQLLHGRVVAKVNGTTVDYTFLPRTGTKNSMQQPEAAVDNPDSLSTIVSNGSRKKRHGADAKALRRAEQSASAIQAKRARRIQNLNLFPGKVRPVY